jgi:hypothetical protein
LTCTPGHPEIYNIRLLITKKVENKNQVEKIFNNRTHVTQNQKVKAKRRAGAGGRD